MYCKVPSDQPRITLNAFKNSHFQFVHGIIFKTHYYTRVET